MKLSAAFLTDLLKANYNILVPEGINTDPVLIYPSICAEDTIPIDNQVYILTCNVLEKLTLLPCRSLFLAIGKGSALVSPRRMNICFILDDISVEYLLAHLQVIFYRYNNWEEDLMRARLKGRPIQHLLDLSVNVLESNLVVISTDFTVIALSGLCGEKDKKCFFENPEDENRMINTLRKSSHYNAAVEKNHAFYLPATVKCAGLLCVNINLQNKTAYRLICLEKDHKISTNSGFLLEFLASIIEHAITHQLISPPASSMSQLRTILLRAIEDPTDDAVTISQNLDSLGWMSRHYYVCFFIRLSLANNQMLTYRSVAGYLQNILPETCVFTFRGNIIAFTNLSLAEITLQDLCVKMRSFTEDSETEAGFSRAMIGHLNLRRQYIQASVALDSGSKKFPGIRVHSFNDISFDYILDKATSTLPGYMISHEKLLRLKDHDELDGSDYMLTLKTYLDNHLNVVKTARDIYIHRSTLLYRLEKIRSILSSSLTDPEEILYLMLSFRFIEREA